jgi:hypothetical protein
MAPDTALMTITAPAGPPTLAQAADQLGISPSKLNSAFGVVPVDPDKGLYAVEVEADAVSAATRATPYNGPYSNPRIEPFGPAQEKKPRK